jgi:hypothetical protein
MISKLDPRPPRPAVLPALEQLLVRAARRGADPRRRHRRRWLLAAAAAALTLSAGAGAATGLLPIAEGETDRGSYTVERLSTPHAGTEPSAGKVCLQLRLEGRGPSYGCGDAPPCRTRSAYSWPIRWRKGPGNAWSTGWVSDEIAIISVLGKGGQQTNAATEPQAGLPGRFFAVITPHLGRIEVVGYDEAGRERAHIGNRAHPDHSPRSKAEAMAQGDPAGFAPTVSAPSTYLYRGENITEAEAMRMQLACLERTRFRCFDLASEAGTSGPAPVGEQSWG